MKIEERFMINAPADAVWAFLIDPERIAAALPGAEITDKVDNTTFKGGMAVRVGPRKENMEPTVKALMARMRMFTRSKTRRTATVSMTAPMAP